MISSWRNLIFLSLATVTAFGCRTPIQDDGSETQSAFRGVSVGDYSDASLHIKDCNGGTFLSFMKGQIFPLIKRESSKPQKSDIAGVRAGDGVEVRFTKDVTTYHVDFPMNRQGGRSFGGVGTNSNKMEYVGDASYTYYFDELEGSYFQDKTQMRDFYNAILGVLLRCDADGFNNLDDKIKRVAADFMAVFIAEQFRNLIGTNGKSLKQNDWDNAHLQTTLLAAFHSGQTRDVKGMFFEGKFTKQTYDTWDCVYNKSDRGGKKPRDMRLHDYTQANDECKRSGVNMTRRDWEKLTKAIGEATKSSSEARAVQKAFGFSSSNIIDSAANFITDDRNDGKLTNSDGMQKAFVDYLMYVQSQAVSITQSLL